MNNEMPWEIISNQRRNIRTNMISNGTMGYGETVNLAGRQYNIPQAKPGSFVPMKGLKKVERKPIAIFGTLSGKVKVVIATLALAAALAAGMGQVTASQEQSHNEWANSQPTYSQVYAQDAEGNYVRLTEEQAEQKEILDENVNSELYSQINSQNTGPVR